MEDKLLARAHRLYDIEGEYVVRLIENDPNFARLEKRLARLERQMAGRLKPQDAQSLQDGRRLMIEITREVAFKMGYLMAHTYPLDEVTGL
jgi:hypothetical protein